jgi:hypothetical protein
MASTPGLSGPWSSPASAPSARCPAHALTEAGDTETHRHDLVQVVRTKVD